VILGMGMDTEEWRALRNAIAPIYIGPLQVMHGQASDGPESDPYDIVLRPKTN
jgi:hypothetical protein